MKTLKIGGVPEHFNWPWHRAIAAHAFARDGVEIRWRDYPEGSGAMAAALNDGEVDLAMLLTEGAVAGIANGRRYGIVSLYTESPLIWGIHVPAQSSLRSVADIEGRRYAISRLGSGSHLMTFVHARRNGWSTDRLELVTVRDLQGAIDAFAGGTADVFFWEKFMTKPLVDAGRFRRVAELVAPWPAFVVCASAAALANERATIATLLRRVFATAAEISASDTSSAQIADRYELDVDDAAAWLRTTRWAREPAIDASVVRAAAGALQDVGLIPTAFDARATIAPL